jgi:dTDP-glucose 4,6-dehydratase
MQNPEPPVLPNPGVVVVTGGSGFIGSAFLLGLVPQLPGTRFVNVDRLTYAANPASLEPLQGLPNFATRVNDIADVDAVESLFDEERPDWVIHFAAESHVDRSILGPGEFVRTNIVGTFNLLDAARKRWASGDHVFHHISTDEVYGSLGSEGAFSETTAYDPSSPYSASKAASDHLVMAYHRTYGLPVRITNCSNNYGPRQHPEKLIPTMILAAAEGRPLPVYGEGKNVRDWLFVDDHVDAIWRVAREGRTGETYCVGGDCEKTNIDVVKAICAIVAEIQGRSLEEIEKQITYVTDRLGHDFRYAIDFTKIRQELGWRPRHSFEEGLRETVRWYLDNPAWIAAARARS